MFLVFGVLSIMITTDVYVSLVCYCVVVSVISFVIIVYLIGFLLYYGWH